MGRVDGKVALVTGAARGMGRATAVRLAQEGADIIAMDIGAQVSSVPYPMSTGRDLQETVALIEGCGRRVVAFEADARNQGAVDHVVESGIREFGRLDVLAVMHGIASFGLLLELDDRTWQDMIDTNLTSVWRCCRAAVPRMVDSGRGGSVIITNSTAGLRAYPNCGHYAAAKWGLVGFMKTLALEVGSSGIRVNSVHPGHTDTPMAINEFTMKLFAPDKEHPTREDASPMTTAMNVLPVDWVDPTNVANAVLFLASDEAAFVTGISLPVDAGTTLK